MAMTSAEIEAAIAEGKAAVDSNDWSTIKEGIASSTKGADVRKHIYAEAHAASMVVEEATEAMEDYPQLKSDLSDKDDRISDIDGIIYLPWELGYCEANGSSGWLYADQNYRIRTPKESYINLKAGDVIESSDSTIIFRLMRYNNGSPAGATAYGSNKFTVKVDDKYKICALIKDSTAEITDITTVSNAISVTRAGKINTIEDEIESIEDEIESIEDEIEIIGENGEISLVWECGSIDASPGKDVYSTTNLRTKNIVHIKAGSTISKKSATTDFAITAEYYAMNDINSRTSYDQVITTKTTSYTFTEDCYIRLLLQYVGSSTVQAQYAYDNLETHLYPCKDYTENGVYVSVYGFDSNSVGRYFLGNCITLKFANGKIFMIDSYINSNVSTTTAFSLLNTEYHKRGIKHLDYFMLTHWHADHCGNIQNLISNGYIDSDTTIFLPTDLDTTQTTGLPSDWDTVVSNMETNKSALVSAGCNIVYPTEGQTIEIADCLIKFWNCDHTVFYDGGTYHSTNYNDFSLCAYLFCGNTNFCFTADLGPIGQQKMVDLGTMVKANLYTATHHGWDNGNADNYYGLIPAWINRLSPDVVFSEDFQTHQNMMDTPTSSEYAPNGFPMQSWCERNGVGNYRGYINGTMDIHINKYGWKFLGGYSRYIRGTEHKNWKFTDNSEYHED